MLLDTVHKLCEDWQRVDRRRHKRICISWVSGHDGVLGNERADAEARKVVEVGSSREEDLPDVLCSQALPCSLAAAGAAFKEDLLKHWRNIWAASPRHKRIDKIDPKLPSYSFTYASLR